MTYEYVMVHSQFRGNDSDDIKSKNWSAPVMLFAHSVAKVMAVCLYSNIAISEVTLQNVRRNAEGGKPYQVML